MRRIAHLAERLGYRNLWFGDSQNIWREVYSTMAAAAVGTDRIIIGTGVTNALTRHRSVLASAWVTLAELTDGRVAAGFGVGDSALETMGVRPMKVAELEEVIRDLRTLWGGDEALHEDSKRQYRLSYLGDARDIPVYIAASGPRMLDLAGRIGDGVILLVGTDTATVSDAVNVLKAAAASADRSLDDIHVVLWAPTAVADNASAARDVVRAHVARTVLRPINAKLTDAEAETVERIRDQYDYYAHMVPGSAHAQMVTDDLVDRFALAGSADECARRLDALSAVGVNQVAFIPFVADGESMDASIRQFADL